MVVMVRSISCKQRVANTAAKSFAAVRDATEAYLAAEDSIANWLEDRCIVAANEQDRLISRFESWKQWAEATGEFAGKRKQFVQTLEDRGFPGFKDSYSRQSMVRGLTLRAVGTEP